MVFIAVIVGLVILAAIVAYVVSYNGISRLRKQTEEALATMESVRRTYESKQAEGMTEEEKKKEDQDLEYAVRYFNGCARSYNQRIETFPGNLIADMLHLPPAKLYAGNDFEQ
mgnify:FL=1